MMTIGEFANATGLTAKALRFYDQTGLLAPAQVDPATAYRLYSPGQVRNAEYIRLLRGTDMSLAEIRTAVGAPDRIDQLLKRHNDGLLAERKRQDRALVFADRMLAAYECSVPVLTRQVEAKHWVGITADLDTVNEGGASLADEYNDRLAAFREILAETGNPPTGKPWTAIPISSGRIATITTCWPVESAVEPADYSCGMVDLVSGLLPARTEAYVRWSITEHEDTENPDDVAGPMPHHGFVTFMDYLEERGIEAQEFRQAELPDDHGSPAGFEVSVTERVLEPK